MCGFSLECLQAAGGRRGIRFPPPVGSARTTSRRNTGSPLSIPVWARRERVTSPRRGTMQSEERKAREPGLVQQGGRSKYETEAEGVFGKGESAEPPRLSASLQLTHNKSSLTFHDQQSAKLPDVKQGADVYLLGVAAPSISRGSSHRSWWKSGEKPGLCPGALPCRQCSRLFSVAEPALLTPGNHKFWTRPAGKGCIYFAVGITLPPRSSGRRAGFLPFLLSSQEPWAGAEAERPP